MSKKCMNCDNNELYIDSIAKCPKCENFLRKIDNSVYSIKGGSKKIADGINKQKEPLIKGRVKNFFQQQMPTFFMTKLYRSLFKGLPYVHSNIINTFQVYSSSGISDRHNNNVDEVIIYGKIAEGKLPEKNEVKVWGKRNKRGTIIATKIKNETSNTWVRINHAASPIIIWILMVLVIFIIYKITQINFTRILLNLKAAIMFTLILIVGAYVFFIRPVKNFFK